jgi:hypothetical protein
VVDDAADQVESMTPTNKARGVLAVIGILSAGQAPTLNLRAKRGLDELPCKSSASSISAGGRQRLRRGLEGRIGRVVEVMSQRTGPIDVPLRRRHEDL